MRKIKLMPDYNCFPLWGASADDVGNIDPEELPISTLLKKKLLDWSQKYDATLNLDDPIESGFRSEEEEQAFKSEGQALALLLQKELGADFLVIPML